MCAAFRSSCKFRALGWAVCFRHLPGQYAVMLAVDDINPALR